MTPGGGGGVRYVDWREDESCRERLVNGDHEEIGPWWDGTPPPRMK